MFAKEAKIHELEQKQILLEELQQEEKRRVEEALEQAHDQLLRLEKEVEGGGSLDVGPKSLEREDTQEASNFSSSEEQEEKEASFWRTYYMYTLHDKSTTDE